MHTIYSFQESATNDVLMTHFRTVGNRKNDARRWTYGLDGFKDLGRPERMVYVTKQHTEDTDEIKNRNTQEQDA